MKQEQGMLTQGPILRVLTRLALPIMASSFLATAYNLTDMVWVGLLGSSAVAGVGAGGMYVWLSQGLATLCRMGGQVHAGQCLGRGERQEAGQYAVAAVQLVTLFGVIFGCICLLFPEFLLSFFLLEDPVSAACARDYLMITCGGIVLSFLNFTLTGLYTAQGNSKTPLLANTLGLVLNMVLDPLLILGVGFLPRLGSSGAAVATVTSQAVVLTVLIAAMKKDNLLRETSVLRLPDRRYFAAILRMGGPSAVQSSAYCAISMVLTRMVSAYGAGAIAVQRVGGQIESLTWNTADGFGAAMNAFAAQNYGAGRLDRVRRGYDLAAISVAVWGAFIGAIFLFFPAPLSALFFHEAQVLPLSVDYFIILSFCEPFMCVELMAIGAMSGLGRTRECSVISIIFTGLRIPLAWGLSRLGLGLNGVWWALTITSMIKGVLMHIAFRWYIGKKPARQGNTD